MRPLLAAAALTCPAMTAPCGGAPVRGMWVALLDAAALIGLLSPPTAYRTPGSRAAVALIDSGESKWYRGSARSQTAAGREDRPTCRSQTVTYTENRGHFLGNAQANQY